MKNKRLAIYDKFNGHCCYCGIKLDPKGWQIDHRIAKSGFVSKIKMGRVPEDLRHLTVDDVDHPDNLFPACRQCNFYKSNFDLEEFRKQLGQILKRLNERQFIYRLARNYNMVTEDSKPIVFYYEK